LRAGELCSLRVGDVDFLRGRLRVAKGRTKGGTQGRRFVPVPALLVAALADLAGPPEDRRLDAPLFSGLTPGALRDGMARACRLAGVALYSPHDLRHRYISRLVLAGVPLPKVREVAGHSRASVTLDVYSHVLLDEAEADLDAVRGLVS